MSSLSSQYASVVIPITLEDLFADEIAGASFGLIDALLIANSPSKNRQLGIEWQLLDSGGDKIWACIEIVEMFKSVARENSVLVWRLGN